MEPEVNTVKCPKCGAEINVSDVLFHQVQDQLKQEYEDQLAQKDKDYQDREKKLKLEREQLTKAQEDLQAQVDTAVKSKLSTEKSSLEKTIKAKVDEEKSAQVLALETELNAKTEQVKQLHKLESDLSRLKREKEEMAEQLNAEAEKKFNDLLAQEKEKIKVTETDKSKLEVQKRDQLISQLQKRLDEAQNKLETGSNKLTGETTEIELRDYLKNEYPIDAVEDVPSGIRGADVIQTVRNNLGAECGIILHERKSTQNFAEAWLDKLRQDGRRVSADVLILVTRAFPKDNPETHMRNGVWVTTFTDLGLLTTLLRDGLIKQFSALSSMQDKTSKMELIYSYLLSNDFVNQITGLLDAYRKMERSLAKEEETAIKQFAERKSHIWQAKKSILGFYGRIEGVTQSVLTEQVKMLEEGDQEEKTK